jgi:23S rRNA (uracil1939-C5)-methyltransferase
MVMDALERIGGAEVESVEIEPSPLEFRYRDRVSFSVRRLGSGAVVAGFRELGRPGRIVDCGRECLLPDESLARVWDDLRGSWGGKACLLPEGDRLRLTLRKAREGAVLLVSGGGEDPKGKERLLAGDAEVEDEWLGERFPFAVRAFLQVNRGGAERLYDSVVDELGPVAGLRVIDAYCGVGLLGRRLARAGAAVVGIERDAVAVVAGGAEAPPGLSFEVGAVEDHLASVLPADRVIVNPPRLGLHASVSELLAKARVPMIVYVSCDPATLARDARRLAEGYRLVRMRSFDLFPQTAHVETVAVFHRHPEGE